MTADTPDAPARARPYGLFGLVVSLIAILIVTTLNCIAGSALVLGLSARMIHWPVIPPSLRDVPLFLKEADLQHIALIASFIFYAGLVVAILAAARLRGSRDWPRLIGWKPWNPFRGSWRFWLLTAITIGLSLVLDQLIARLYPPSKDWVTLPPERLWAGLLILLAVAFAPVAEEILFRGWMYTALRAKAGAIVTILVCAVLFALAHWESTHIYALAVLPVGLVLGFVRESNGGLKASMTLHAAYNAAASVMLLLGF